MASCPLCQMRFGEYTLQAFVISVSADAASELKNPTANRANRIKRIFNLLVHFLGTIVPDIKILK